jgi:uncharacterized protein (DUF427 family)
MESAMSHSPGHRQWPDHRVQESPVAETMVATLAGIEIARSDQVVKVEETGHPERYYFPRADVQMYALQRSPTTTHCPFKGDASYFHVDAGGRSFDDAAWSYEAPYDEHRALKDRIAFADDSHAELRVAPAS